VIEAAEHPEYRDRWDSERDRWWAAKVTDELAAKELTDQQKFTWSEKAMGGGTGGVVGILLAIAGIYLRNRRSV